MRRTKIVATLGPKTDSPEQIRRLIQAGMNVARQNLSHGTLEYHRELFERVRRIAEELDANIAIMFDLQGPRIRTGRLEDDEPVLLEMGAPIDITMDDVPGNRDRISTTYANLAADVQAGDQILIADGALELRVEAVSNDLVHCRVIRGGLLGANKGINLPGVAVSSPALTPKDRDDIELGLELGVDYIALSFVRRGADISELRSLFDDARHRPSIVAKIERHEALENFDEILEWTDAVMVARGDLGVEVGLADVPQIQKDIIRRCNHAGTPVITATQMLESMLTSPRPTRAEANDVANAIYDGTDAVMLSGETAIGDFPVEAVAFMAAIAEKTDAALIASPPHDLLVRQRSSQLRGGTFSNAMGQAACRLAYVLDVKRIVCFTQAGSTASVISRWRPPTPIVAISHNEETQRKCALFWGVRALPSVSVADTDEMVRVVDDVLMQRGLASTGDVVLIAAGTPLGASPRRANLLHLHTVGDT